MKYLHGLAYSLMVALLLVTFIGFARDNARLRVENQLARYRLHWIEDSALRLSEGEGELSIYSMKDTDGLLSCFAARFDVESVSLEVTDVGPDGIRSITTLPNVRSISFSGDFGVNDETLLLLEKCENLETLALNCTNVTDAGISQLKRFPSLRNLTLGQGMLPMLTNESLKHLGKLQQLETLTLTEWATVDEVEELRLQIPGCRIEHREPSIVSEQADLRGP